MPHASFNPTYIVQAGSERVKNYVSQPKHECEFDCIGFHLYLVGANGRELV